MSELTLMSVLQDLYRSEINATVTCFWDGGWEIKLGDPMNGFKAEYNFDNEDLGYAPGWIIKMARQHWPDSQFARLFAHFDAAP